MLCQVYNPGAIIDDDLHAPAVPADAQHSSQIVNRRGRRRHLLATVWLSAARPGATGPGATVRGVVGDGVPLASLRRFRHSLKG